MTDLYKPLNDDEIDQLDQFLLNRIPEDSLDQTSDEGIFDISTLDGFFTAIVSGPVTIQPSKWLPSLWGDFEPVWESKAAFSRIFSLLIRHMNLIAMNLMEFPDEFEPLFLERTVNDRVYTIVDEWCDGYRRGMALASDRWDNGDESVATMLVPILAFTEASNWQGHDYPEDELEELQQAIAPSVRAIHAYWLIRRESDLPLDTPFRRGTPRVERNDPCPCGSGKKYKKCCLH